MVAVFITRGAQIPEARSPSRLNFEGWRLIFVGIQRHPSGAHNSEVPPRFFKNMCTLVRNSLPMDPILSHKNPSQPVYSTFAHVELPD